MRDTRLPVGRIFNRAPVISNAAIAVHHTATVDEPWDANAAVSAMPNSAATLHACFAWEDHAGSDVKEDYKFPHHKTEGGPANIPACRNGLARLANSSIPDGDKAGVKAHLQAHLDDFHGDDNDGPDDQITRFLARRREGLKALGKPATGTRRWYTIQARAAAPDDVDVMITGEIGWDVDSGTFARALAVPDVANATTLHVSLNSVGGDVFDGIGIFNALVNHGGRVIVTVTGIAASIASVIAMAGDTVIMGRGAQMMIHDAHAIQIGNAADMRQMADILDRASDNIASFYADRAGGTTESWRAVMRDEKWYNAQEAVDAGLADEVASVPERKVTSASPITLAARAHRTPAARTGDEGGPGSGLTPFDFGAAVDDLKSLGDDLRTAYAAPADDPVDGLGDAIRSAVAFAASTTPEPPRTAVDDALPPLDKSHLADIRRALKEGL